MKLPQAPSFSFERFKKELITFPGYAGVLLGWLGVLVATVAAIATQFGQTTPTQVVVEPQVIAPPTLGSTVVATLLGLLVVVALLGALWIYVARWTKAGVAWLAKLCRVPKYQYWAFCTALLVVGWLLVVGIAFLVSGDEYLGSAAFLAALAIAVGGASFGLAALLEQGKLSKMLQKPKKSAGKAKKA